MPEWKSQIRKRLSKLNLAAAREELVPRGVEVSEVFHCATGTVCRFRDGDGVFERVSGPAPDHTSYGSFAAISDPDGNGWLLQEVTARLPGPSQQCAEIVAELRPQLPELRLAGSGLRASQDRRVLRERRQGRRLGGDPQAGGR